MNKTNQKETKLFSLFKLRFSMLEKSEFNLNIDINDENIKEYGVKLPNSPLFDQLFKISGGIPKNRHIEQLVFVIAKRNVKKQNEIKGLLQEGFHLNGKHYIRFGKSPSQGKDGITAFIDKDYYDEMTERSKLGLNIDKCVISKYESYRSLIFSSCSLVESKFNGGRKLPNIVIIDEFEKTLEKQWVRYATEVDTDYTYTDKETGEEKVRKNRVIKEGYTDIKISPFDGFGVHSPEINTTLQKAIEEDNHSVLFQIRLPFMKGVTIEMDFEKYFKEVLKVNTVTDVFGKVHNIDDVDCIWNTTMWKGYAYFKKAFGNDAWTEYLDRVDKYDYKLGISKYSHHMDDRTLYSRLNFQYLQCLDLINPKYVEKFKTKNRDYDILNLENDGKIIKLARYSTDFVEKIIGNDEVAVLKYLGIHNTEDMEKENSKYIQAILINNEMLNDISVRKMLKRKVNKTINMMKYGKIYTRGFYHTVIGDIFGYLEYAGGLTPVGTLKYGEFHAQTLPLGKTTSMRSPLVDPSEVNNVDLVETDKTKKYLEHLKGQDIVMINMYDLSMQQQGGMDEDGDSVLLTDEPLIVDSKINLPIVVDLTDKETAKEKEYNLENIVEYEWNSRDSRIGEITNVATSILNTYTEKEKWQKIMKDYIALLRLYQGKEIDFLKTGSRWHLTKNMLEYLKRLPYFLLFNYPNKKKVYDKIVEINRSNTTGNEKIPTNAFHSPTPMNELCDYVCQWEKKRVDWRNVNIKTRNLLINNGYTYDDRHIKRKIKHLLNNYAQEVNKLTDASDAEYVKDKYKDELIKLKNELGLSDKLFANYCIHSAYSSVSVNKSLCWYVYGDVMINNLKYNTPKSKSKTRQIVECEPSDNATEFLGRYYKIEEVELDNA